MKNDKTYPTLKWMPTSNKSEISHAGIITFTHPETNNEYYVVLDVLNEVYDVINVDKNPDKTYKDIGLPVDVELFYPPVFTYESISHNVKQVNEKYNGVYDADTNPNGMIIVEESIVKFINEWGL